MEKSAKAQLRIHADYFHSTLNTVRSLPAVFFLRKNITNILVK